MSGCNQWKYINAFFVCVIRLCFDIALSTNDALIALIDKNYILSQGNLNVAA